MCVALLASMKGLGQRSCNVIRKGLVDVVLMVGEPFDVATARVVVSLFRCLKRAYLEGKSLLLIFC